MALRRSESPLKHLERLDGTQCAWCEMPLSDAALHRQIRTQVRALKIAGCAGILFCLVCMVTQLRLCHPWLAAIFAVTGLGYVAVLIAIVCHRWPWGRR